MDLTTLRNAIDNVNTLPFVVLMLPLFGFVVLALFGDWIKRDREQKGAMILACALVVLSFLGAVRVGMHMQVGPDDFEARRQQIEYLKGTPYTPSTPYLPYQPYLDAESFVSFIEVADLRVPISLLLDPLTLIMMLVITGIGSLIHIYSLGYMSHDEERVRYFSYLNLFTFFMLLLIMGGSLPLLFIGWEGVGLCSYLLIGFWFKKKSASDAGKKAFIVNRIGDAGLILGMALAFAYFGELTLFNLIENVLAAPTGEHQMVVTALCLLLFVGACGKSAQIPLHVWLPDAMEGPTPVSALIHAATMVTAGVYMVARLGPIYARSETALGIILIVGTATAVMAATVALVQTDIKKVLAYSTVSQLGYMFMACGVGAFGFAVFHVFTHAFFKALLFLGSGSVIHALSGEQDMRQMGGLRKKIPWTFWTFVVGSLAIAGIYPFAGFFSKDAILAAVFEHHRPVIFFESDRVIFFAIGMFTAMLTAFYMWRMVFLTFFGKYRGGLESAAHGHGDAHGHAPETKDEHGHGDHGHVDHGHGHGHGGIHESPWSMLIPLILLSIGSVVAGFIPINQILAPVFRATEAAEHHPHWLPWAASATAILGIAAAWYLYLARPGLTARAAESFAALRRVFEAKWGFDLAYDWFARYVVVGGSAEVLWRRVDAKVIDGAVNGTGTLAARLGAASRTVQSGLVRSYVLLILGGAIIVLSYLLWIPR